MYYAQNRFYDPRDHRFTQEDPVKDGVNWYAYCDNDPVNSVDPMGHNSMSMAAQQGVIYGGQLIPLIAAVGATLSAAAVPIFVITIGVCLVIAGIAYYSATHEWDALEQEARANATLQAQGYTASGVPAYVDPLYQTLDTPVFKSIDKGYIDKHQCKGSDKSKSLLGIKPITKGASAIGGDPNNDDDDDQSGELNLKKLTKQLLNKYGLDAHKIKYEYLGKKASISNYDLAYDTYTKQIFIITHIGQRIVEATDYFLK